MRAFFRSAPRQGKLLRLAVVILPTIALFFLLAQTAFAENTYLISDGGQVMLLTSSAATPEAVLTEAGVTLAPEDTYTTGSIAGIGQITVQRGQRITVNYRGQAQTVDSHGETVENLLQRLQISLEEADSVSYDLAAQTFDGMSITVTDIRKQEQSYSVPVPHDTIYCDDASLPAGQETVITAGTDGEALCRAEVTYVNGQETDRKILSHTVTAQPVTEIIGVGTGENVPQPEAVDPDMPVIGNGTITLPTGEVLTYTDTIQVSATGYSCDGYGITYTGTVARVGAIAVDPRVIPYGTRMYIVSNDGEYIYGIASAEDCGGGIKGHKVDLYFNTSSECWQFGVRPCTIYILG